MSGEVISLGKPGSAVPGQPDAKVIEALERWLEMARRGELSAVAVTGINPGGSTFTGWAGSVSATLLLGAVCGLKARMTARWLEDD